MYVGQHACLINTMFFKNSYFLTKVLRNSKTFLAKNPNRGTHLTSISKIRYVSGKLECLESVVVGQKTCFWGITFVEQQIGIPGYFPVGIRIFATF